MFGLKAKVLRTVKRASCYLLVSQMMFARAASVTLLEFAAMTKKIVHYLIDIFPRFFCIITTVVIGVLALVIVFYTLTHLLSKCSLVYLVKCLVPWWGPNKEESYATLPPCCIRTGK